MIRECQPGRWPDEISPARMASAIRLQAPAGARVALLGMPDDLGVRLNAGRPGAAEGPTAFRAALARFGVADPASWQWPTIFDAGDVLPALPPPAGPLPSASFAPKSLLPPTAAAALTETHRRVSTAVADIVAMKSLPVGIGGGHDLTFPFIRGVLRPHPPLAPSVPPPSGPAAQLSPVVSDVSVLYFDAHLDVRAAVGSGMPFRRLVEDCGVRRLAIVGFSPLVNSREHVEWFLAQGGVRLRPRRGEVLGFARQGPLAISVDLDAFSAADAPGVSALNPAGLRVRRVARLLRELAHQADVRCLDIMDLNPRFDQDARTARLAVFLFLNFLRGLADRDARR